MSKRHRRAKQTTLTILASLELAARQAQQRAAILAATNNTDQTQVEQGTPGASQIGGQQ
jgi:hypothetical protein